jgi:hypothetical protein
VQGRGKGAPGTKFLNSSGAPYVCRLTDECTVIYIRRLTDKYSDLRSSMLDIFLGICIKEYILVIFISTEEYNKTEEYTLLSCSDRLDIRTEGLSHDLSFCD